jgi:hypothetical protein
MMRREANMLANASPAVKKVQFFGGALFLISYALPAIWFHGTWDAYPATLRGYQCVEESVRMLYEVIKMLKPHEGYYEPWTRGFISGVCGFINPLVIWYLFASPKWRRRVAIMICVLILETWIALALSPVSPLYGYFLWICGTLLILAPEVSAWADGSES